MFKSEKQLSRVIKQKLVEDPGILFKSKRQLQPFFAEELSIGHGVADLVVSFCKKVNKRKQSLNIYEIATLNVIQSEVQVNQDQLQHVLKISPTKIRSIVNKLETEGFIAQQRNKVQSVYKYENYQAETFAIEIKLKNWKRALEQAYRYKSFAYSSYVFLDKNFVDPAMKNRSLFFQYNIGLASVSIKGEIEILHRPTKENPFDERLNMLLNESIVDYFLSCKKVNQGSR